MTPRPLRLRLPLPLPLPLNFTLTGSRVIERRRSLVVNLKDPRGLAIMRKKLRATADVFSENFKAGSRDKLGLGEAAPAARDEVNEVNEVMQALLRAPGCAEAEIAALVADGVPGVEAVTP